MMNEQIRELFEQHIAPNFLTDNGLKRRSNGQYVDYLLDDHWQTFQEASNLIAKECVSIMEHAHDNKMRLSDAIWNTRTKFGLE